MNRFVLVVAEDSEVTLYGLDGAREVEVEAKSNEYVRLQLHEVLFSNVLLFSVCEQAYHS